MLCLVIVNISQNIPLRSGLSPPPHFAALVVFCNGQAFRRKRPMQPTPTAALWGSGQSRPQENNHD